jgi:Tol biopolymer transport system component
MIPRLGKFAIRELRAAWLLLFLLAPLAHSSDSSGRIKSLAVSPDGKLIAVEFAKGNTSFIYKIQVDTGRATKLTNAQSGEESTPAFSPDGERIAYSYLPAKAAHSTIVIGNVDGSHLHSWSPSDADDFSPVFSPDNKTIIFARSGFYGSYSPIAQPHHHAWSFYESDLDGTNLRALTSESFFMASAASVSPDGKNMAIVTEGLDTNREIAIYSLDHPGKPLQSLQPHVPNEADHKDPILDFPNYTPDGKSILFMAASNGKHGYDYDVYRVDLKTGSVETITNENGYATDLRVSADGKTAAFLKWRSDWHSTPVQSKPYLLDTQSHKVTPLKITGLD